MASFHDQWMDAHAEVSALPESRVRTAFLEALSETRAWIDDYEDDPTPGLRCLIGDSLGAARRAAAYLGRQSDG